jgi:hypothetical protein
MSESYDNNNSIVPQEVTPNNLGKALSALSKRQRVVVSQYIALLSDDPTPENEYRLKLFWDLLEDRLTLDEYLAFRDCYDIDNPYQGGAE